MNTMFNIEACHVLDNAGELAMAQWVSKGDSILSGKVNEVQKTGFLEGLKRAFPDAEVLKSGLISLVMHNDFKLIYLPSHERVYYNITGFRSFTLLLETIGSYTSLTLGDLEIANYYLGHDYSGNPVVEFKEMIRKPDDLGEVLQDTLPFLSLEKLVEEYLVSEESILMLSGKTGTGKTSVIRKVLKDFLRYRTDPNPRIAYVKDESLLEMPSFWASLETEKYSVLILDDFSKSLSKSDSFVPQLLSFSDGVLGNNTKIIITTNEESVAQALLRPQRCFDFLKLRYLTQDEARTVWGTLWKLSLEVFDKAFGGLQEVSQASLYSERNRASKGTYLIDPSISLRAKILRET